MKAAPVKLDRVGTKTVGSALIRKLRTMEIFVHCLSCGATHVHLLYESNAHDAIKEVGRAKQYASHQLKSRSGRVWAKGAKVIEVRDAAHAGNVRRYVEDHARKEGAWVWVRED